ncbi:hypothetical protein [Thermosulfurimonas sp.]|uniref:hypothetical protein n=1 Tax=Thermosulfurimonas sp. TaxID=2080236 RepID=UPI0025CE1765|nr:hypothetical protein [Thermosulfurimonas sp.]
MRCLTCGREWPRELIPEEELERAREALYLGAEEVPSCDLNPDSAVDREDS